MKPILMLALLVGPTILFSQTINWSKKLGGSVEDYSACTKQTSDGGYIVAGASASNDGNVSNHRNVVSYNYDFWIVKLNKSGSIKWQKSIGGSGDDVANYIEQTTDDGYIVAGYTSSIDGDVTGNHGRYDYWVVKLNSSGIIEWQKSLGGKKYDFAKTVHQTTDGGYIVAGYSNSNDANVSENKGNDDYWIVKLDGKGNVVWEKSYGGAKYDQATAISQTKDGGYIVSGYSNSNNGDVSDNLGGYDYWILKLNSNGSLAWQKNFGGISDDLAYDVHEVTGGGYIVAGYSFSNTKLASDNHGGSDYWIVKLDKSGVAQWQKSYGGTGNDLAYSIQQTAEGGYVVGGYSTSPDGDLIRNLGKNDYWLLKLSSTGGIQWQKSYGGSGDDIAYNVIQNDDGGYLITGNTSSNDKKVRGNHGEYDYWIVKLNPVNVFINTNTGTNICVDTKVTFTAVLTNGQIPKKILWKKNDKAVGKGITYIDSTINNKDTIICIYDDSVSKYYSNRLIFTVNQKMTPVVNVNTNTGSQICTGSKVTFTASSKSQGLGDDYNWFKNNIYTGVNGNIYSDKFLKDKDSVWTVLKTNAFCLITNKISSSPIIISVDASIPPNPGLINGPILVLPGQKNLTYKVNEKPGATFTWEVPDGSVITSGNGTSSIRVNWGSISGRVKVETVNGCGKSVNQSKLQVDINLSNFSSNSTEKAQTSDYIFYASPNPVKNTVTINFSTSGTYKYLLEVSDISGRVILSKQNVSAQGLNQIHFNMGNYNAGLYFITLITSENKQVSKIIKE